jgi:hypothetical protein
MLPLLAGFFLLPQPKGRTMTATISTTESQLAFYKRWLMGRAAFDPKEFAINMDREDLIDLFVDELNGAYKGQLTIDELCLHPREALHFCDDLRRKHGFIDLPDDTILRSIMGRRKHP